MRECLKDGRGRVGRRGRPMLQQAMDGLLGVAGLHGRQGVVIEGCQQLLLLARAQHGQAPDRRIRVRRDAVQQSLAPTKRVVCWGLTQEPCTRRGG